MIIDPSKLGDTRGGALAHVSWYEVELFPFEPRLCRTYVIIWSISTGTLKRFYHKTSQIHNEDCCTFIFFSGVGGDHVLFLKPKGCLDFRFKKHCLLKKNEIQK